VIGLYHEPGWENVTALFLPETTDSLFLRLRRSHGLLFRNRLREALPIITGNYTINGRKRVPITSPL
jgi:hypothetical protein